MAAVTPSPCRYAPRDLAASAVASVAGVAASVAEIAASEEVSTEAHEAALAAAIAVLVAPPTATEARLTHRADLAMAAAAGTAADLTATAETTEVVAVVATVVAMTTGLAAAAAAATEAEALTDLVLAATQSPLAPVTVAAAAAVGIATETMTGETTPGSAPTKVVRAMKENGSFVGINRDKPRPLLVLWWVSSCPLISLFLRPIFSLPPSSTRVSRWKTRNKKTFPHWGPRQHWREGNSWLSSTPNKGLRRQLPHTPNHHSHIQLGEDDPMDSPE